MNRLAPLCLALAAFAGAGAAAAEATANTSVGYAQVLRVEPVYELRTVQAVYPECLRPDHAPAPPGRDCKPHAVAVRRIVAYDVEYSYKGETYMSRLKQGPGSRLRVRVTVVPDDEGAPPSVAPPDTR
jgi:uncharacterized protein YcfJ